MSAFLPEPLPDFLRELLPPVFSSDGLQMLVVGEANLDDLRRDALAGGGACLAGLEAFLTEGLNPKMPWALVFVPGSDRLGEVREGSMQLALEMMRSGLVLASASPGFAVYCEVADSDGLP